MKRKLAWLVRGGDQTRAEFAAQAAAIQELQRQVADLGAAVTRIDPLAQSAAGVPEQLRTITDDLAERIGNASLRLDVLEARLDQLDETLTELVRVVTPTSD